MTKEQVIETVKEVFWEVFDDEDIEITNETTAKDVDEWDSLAHLQLIAYIEKKFSIHFSLGEINSFANVGEMCDCIIKHIS